MGTLFESGIRVSNARSHFIQTWGIVLAAFNFYAYMSVESSARRRGTYLILYECCEGKEVEEVCKAFPHIGVAVLAEALIVEPVPAPQALEIQTIDAEDGFELGRRLVSYIMIYCAHLR